MVYTSKTDEIRSHVVDIMKDGNEWAWLDLIKEVEKRTSYTEKQIKSVMPGMMETLVGKDKYSVYRVKRGVFKRGYVGKIDKKGIREKLVYRLQDVKKKTDEDIKEYINKINFDEDDMNSKLSDIKELKSVLDKLDDFIDQLK